MNTALRFQRDQEQARGGEVPPNSTEYNWRLDALRNYELACELARDGNQQIIDWFNGWSQ